MGIIAVLFVLGYFCLRKHDAKVDAQITSQVLPPEDKAKYIIDEKRHEIIEVEAAKEPGDQSVIKRQFLSPRSTVEIRKDNSISVTSRTWGAEVSPFVGFGVDTQTRGRGALGLDLFYWHNFELGAGIAISAKAPNTVSLFASASYCVWDNTAVAVGIDHHKTPFVMLNIKF